MRPTTPIARLLLVLVFVATLGFVVLSQNAETVAVYTTEELQTGAAVLSGHRIRDIDAARLQTRAPLRSRTEPIVDTDTAPTKVLEENIDIHLDIEVADEVHAPLPTSNIENDPIPTNSIETNTESTHTDVETTPIVPREQEPIVLSSSLNLSEILLLLEAHNDGRETVGVPPLTWSPTLAASAQAWADTLEGESCAWYHGDTPYGENIFYSWSSDDSFRRNADEPVFWWLNKEQYYDYDDNECKPGEVCGHYTQVVWADTRELGCGRVYCNEDKYFKEVWVCQYDPPGNYVGERPY